MIYGYIRISTEHQDFENQKYGILQYNNKKAFGVINLVEEKISSTKALKERDLSKLIDRLEKGDILITTELSRLGRSLIEIMGIFQTLIEKGVETHLVKNDMVIKSNDIQSNVMIFAFGLASQIERELISKRTKEALARKKAQGFTLGRKKGTIIGSKLDPYKEDIQKVLNKKVSISLAAKLFKVSRVTMHHFIERNALTVPNRKKQI